MVKVHVRVLPAVERTSKWRYVRRFAKPVVVILVLVAVVIVAKEFLPVQKYLHKVQKWVEANQGLGAITLPLLTWVALPLFIPCSLLEIIAGSLFGIPLGVVISLIGKTGGALIAFGIGRTLGKERIGTYLQTRVKFFRAMCEVLESSDWKPLILIQLSGLPNAVKCYALSITGVTWWRFTITIFLGGVPHAIVWSYVGHETQDILNAPTDGGEKKALSGPQLGMLIGGTLLTLLALVTMSIYAKNQLQKHHAQVHVGSFSTKVKAAPFSKRRASAPANIAPSRTTKSTIEYIDRHG